MPTSSIATIVGTSLALVFLSCARNPTQPEETQRADEKNTPAPETGKSEDVQPKVTEATARGMLEGGNFFDPVTYETITRLSHKKSQTSPLQVDLHPYCAPQMQPVGGTSPVEKTEWSGLKSADYEPLVEQVSQVDEFVGLVLDGSRRKVVLVFEPEFTSWEGVQQMLTPNPNVKIELRPACHNKDQRTRALVLLNRMKSDKPSFIHGWTDEPSVAGFRVFVLPGDQKAATHVREQLGSIANVWFSRPFGEH